MKTYRPRFDRHQMAIIAEALETYINPHRTGRLATNRHEAKEILDRIDSMAFPNRHKG